MRAPTVAHRRRTREKRKRLHCQDDRVVEEAFVEPRVGTDEKLKLEGQVVRNKLKQSGHSGYGGCQETKLGRFNRALYAESRGAASIWVQCPLSYDVVRDELTQRAQSTGHQEDVPDDDKYSEMNRIGWCHLTSLLTRTPAGCSTHCSLRTGRASAEDETCAAEEGATAKPVGLQRTDERRWAG